MKEKFRVTGMSCAACVAHVSKAVKSVYGVKDVNVNLLTNSMEVEFENINNVKDINAAVKKAGYKSELYRRDDDKGEISRIIIRLVLSLIFLIPLFYFSMGHMVGWNIFYFHNHLKALGIMLMLLSLVMMIINNKFFVSGFKALTHKSPNMDTLVMLGSGVAFIYSSVILIIMLNSSMDNLMRYSMNLSFETAGMVPTLITIGKLLEAYSKGKTTDALNDLINLEPKKACVIRNGEEVIIDPKEVVVGDLFIVRPGEAIPVDGYIMEGITSIDESSLTGESMPSSKKKDDNVYSATNNIDGTIKCQATSVGSETAFSKIIKMVEDASQSKAPIARIADKISGIFVPIIIIISIIVFSLWMLLGKSFVSNHQDEMLLTYSIERAIAVLVIACPCALGLATPVAIMVGNGIAAKNGILFKNAEILENAGKISFVVLDKTGTITKGTMSVSNVISYDSKFVPLAASIESLSSHPIAKAITSYYDGEIYKLDDFKNIPGRGVYAKYNGYDLYGVNQKYASEIIDLSSEEINIGNSESSLGRTPLYFIYNKKLIGIISVSDTIKDDSKVAIEKFKKMGITPIMLTGDNYRSANYIASLVGIDYFVSDVLPEEKLDVISKLKKYGSVSMIGDGINDSPALTASDVGIAIGNGSDVAISSSDVVLVKSSLMDAVAAIKISRKTLVNIKENLFWAFIYNLIMIPIAAGVFSFAGLYKMKPWYGALAMSLSSLCVVVNALRLNLLNPYKINADKKMIDISIDDIIKEDNMNKIIINVNGMMCEKCVAHVEEACKKNSGVLDANASLDNKNVVIYYNDNINENDIKKSIIEAGYEVK